MVSTAIYTRQPLGLRGGAVMCSNTAREMGFTDKGNRIPELRKCIFFRPLPPLYPSKNECILSFSVDPHSTYVYDQEYHATKGFLKGEPRMLLYRYLRIVRDFLQDPEWDYVFWSDLCNPCRCRYPIQPHHLKESRYIIPRRMLGRTIHEVRIFRDKIPFRDFRLVSSQPPA